MLQLRLAPSREVLGAAVCGKPSGIPKSNWRLHTELVLEGRQRDLHRNVLSLACLSRHQPHSFTRHLFDYRKLGHGLSKRIPGRMRKCGWYVRLGFSLG